MITLQYLEPGPLLAELSPRQVGDKLRAALALLPIDALLLGWEIPAALEDVCRDVTADFKTKLYRWHPLLTGDGTIYPEIEWQTRNIKGLPLPGFRSLPEFTFICPNNPAVREMIFAHVTDLAQSGRYEGVFLDRMRFPSPAIDPVNALACFCEHCHRAASETGLDVSAVRQDLLSAEKHSLLRGLFDSSGTGIERVGAFLDFRQKVIAQFVQEVVSIVRASGIEVGLDCFSPSLTRMVGQDLSNLAPLADWTKIMVYAHAFGPATLPFECTDLLNWLSQGEEGSEAQAFAALEAVTEFPHPAAIASLRANGFPPETLSAEIIRGRQMGGGSQLLAGIELVEMPGVSELNPAQIEADLRAIKAAGADGLSLSWDLWHIPLERLELIRSVWFS